jgi:ribosome-associated protein
VATTKRTARKRAAQTAPPPAAEAAPESPAPEIQHDAKWLVAVRAAESKKAIGIQVLDLRPVTTFTDFFVICSGANSRQIQAIADEVTQRLKEVGERPSSVEGYDNAEWILADFGDYVVHIFAEQARQFYDLERLWRGATVVAAPPEPE